MAENVFAYELRSAGETVRRGEVRATNVWHAMDQLTSQLWSPQYVGVEEILLRRGRSGEGDPKRSSSA